MLDVLVCLRASVLDVLVCLRVLACLLVMSLRAQMSYMLAVLKHFTYLRACVLGILKCLVYFTFEKLISKNSYVE